MLRKKANFENLTEIFEAISQSGGIKASAYYTPGGIIRPCALMLDVNWELRFSYSEPEISEEYLNRKMRIDYLPTTGHSNTEILEEYLNRNLFLLKHFPVEYARAVFWNTEKPLSYVDLRSMEEHHAHIVSWQDCGYYCIFNVKLENEESVRECRASEYGKSWVFLDPET